MGSESGVQAAKHVSKVRGFIETAYSGPFFRDWLLLLR